MDPPLPKSFNRNKHLKEKVVSNLSGSSMLEYATLTVNIHILVRILHSLDPSPSSIIGAYLKKKNDDAVCGTRFECNLCEFSMLKYAAHRITMLILVLIRHSISFSSINDACPKKKNDDAVSGTRNFKAYLATLSLDFLIIVVPMLLIFTEVAHWNFCSFTIFTILTLLYIEDMRSGGSSLSLKGKPNSLLAFVMLTSHLVMIITFLCILAVDFRMFPRRYEKTASYGISLMDIGLGAFLLANSFVSWQARNITSINRKSTVVSSSPLVNVGYTVQVQEQSGRSMNAEGLPKRTEYEIENQWHDHNFKKSLASTGKACEFNVDPDNNLECPWPLLTDTSDEEGRDLSSGSNSDYSGPS